jgi:hypothetical protein
MFTPRPCLLLTRMVRALRRHGRGVSIAIAIVAASGSANAEWSESAVTRTVETTETVTYRDELPKAGDGNALDVEDCEGVTVSVSGADSASKVTWYGCPVGVAPSSGNCKRLHVATTDANYTASINAPSVTLVPKLVVPPVSGRVVVEARCERAGSAELR